MSHRALRRRRFLIAAMLTSTMGRPHATGPCTEYAGIRATLRPRQTAQKDGTQLSAGSRSGNL